MVRVFRASMALTAVLAGAVMLRPGSVSAEDILGVSVEGQIGLVGIYGPDYEGSDEYEVSGFPLLDVEVAETVFLRRTALGVNAITLQGSDPDDRFIVGPIVNYAMGRDENDNDALNGLGDIDDTFEAGLFLSYETGPWSFDATGLTDVGDGHEGSTISASAGYGFSPFERLFVNVSVGTEWADDDYMGSVFGISASQAAQSGYQAFDAGAGFKSVGSELLLTYQITDRWAATALIGVDQLLGDAADSPIVDDEGSATQGRLILGFGYRF